MKRNGDWLQTYKGRQFWPLDPKPEEVFLDDIAHALGNLCRFNGHCTRFYSVAEHCVHVSREVPHELALMGLLHDASEAYVADVPRPLKPFLKEYSRIEFGVECAIYERFGIKSKDILQGRVEVKRADNAMLAAEYKAAMTDPPREWNLPEPAAERDVYFWKPTWAAYWYIKRFEEICQATQ